MLKCRCQGKGSALTPGGNFPTFKSMGFFYELNLLILLYIFTTVYIFIGYFIKVFLDSVHLFYITSSILCARLPCMYLCKPEPPDCSSLLCHLLPPAWTLTEFHFCSLLSLPQVASATTADSRLQIAGGDSGFNYIILIQEVL